MSHLLSFTMSLAEAQVLLARLRGRGQSDDDRRRVERVRLRLEAAVEGAKERAAEVAG